MCVRSCVRVREYVRMSAHVHVTMLLPSRRMAPAAQSDEPAFSRFVRWLIDPEVDADLRAQGMGYDDAQECRAFRRELRAAQNIVRAAVANNFHAPLSDVREFDNLVESMTQFIGHDIMMMLLRLENGHSPWPDMDGSDFWF